MSFFRFFGVGIWDAEGAQGNALINFNVLSDNCCFADNDACSVVDKEAWTDLRAGVNVDARSVVDVFTHHAREDWNAALVELVGQSVNGECAQSGIGQNDFGIAFGGRIAFIGGAEIDFEHFSNRRKAVEKIGDNLNGMFSGAQMGGRRHHSALGAVFCIADAVGNKCAERFKDFGNSASNAVFQALTGLKTVDEARVKQAFEFVG